MRTILIIDDEVAVRKMMSVILRRRGFEVIEADGALDGLRLSKMCKADLILSDVNMPEMDGFALLEAVRKEPATATTPLILLTGKPDRDGQRRARESGASDYLAKPISGTDLAKAVNTHLRKNTD